MLLDSTLHIKTNKHVPLTSRTIEAFKTQCQVELLTGAIKEISQVASGKELIFLREFCCILTFCDVKSNKDR